MTEDDNERIAVLEQLEAWVETPMQVLSFLWLLLVLLELTHEVPRFVTWIVSANFMPFCAGARPWRAYAARY